VDRHLAAATPDEQIVRTGEGIDTVVVRPVRKSGQLIEQLLAPPAADGWNPAAVALEVEVQPSTA
jgi:hypothetical protein